MKAKKRRQQNIFTALSVTVLVLYAISLLVPLAWVLLASLKDPVEFRLSPFGFNKTFVFSNYIEAFKSFAIETLEDGKKVTVYIEGMLYNSLVYAIGCSIISTMTNCVVAYIVARYSHFRFTKWIYAFVVFTMVMPIVGSLPSELQMAKTLGFYDNMWGIYLMKAYFGGSNFLIFYATFKGFAKEYAEAAKLDGAGETQIMFQIMLPLAMATIGAVFLLAFITYWNDYYAPMIFLPSRPTIAYGLYRFRTNTGTTSGGITVKLAACSILIVPILILFICVKDKIMKNVSIGGIKG